MCRIGGIIYGKNREEINTAEIASVLFAEMIYQGPHAWGFATYNESDEMIRWTKQEGKCDSKAAERYQLSHIDPDAKWAIFHSRYATHGSPSNNANNHPIRHDDIIGVHNGVLSNHEEVLAQTGRYDDAAEVDSEAIFAAVNKWGNSAGLRKIQGNAVAVYADLNRPHLLHIARTNGRVLNLGWTEKGNLIFASDKFALTALEVFGIKFKKFSVVGENKILVLRNGQIIARHQFRKPEPKVWSYKPVAKVNTKPSTSRGTDAWAEDLYDWYKGRNAYDDSFYGGLDPITERENTEAFNRALDRENALDLVRYDRASRRGELLFPKNSDTSNCNKKSKKSKKNKRNRKADQKLDLLPSLPVRPQVEDGDGTELFIWRDLLLTKDEYEEALEFPERYERYSDPDFVADF